VKTIKKEKKIKEKKVSCLAEELQQREEKVCKIDMPPLPFTPPCRIDVSCKDKKNK